MTTTPTPDPSGAASAPELDLAAIRARADAATPGPWRQTTLGVFQASAPDPGPFGEQRGFICRTYQDVLIAPGEITNSRFIAHARADVPALCAEVERLRAERDRLREALKPLARISISDGVPDTRLFVLVLPLEDDPSDLADSISVRELRAARAVLEASRG